MLLEWVRVSTIDRRQLVVKWIWVCGRGGGGIGGGMVVGDDSGGVLFAIGLWVIWRESVWERESEKERQQEKRH